MAVEADTILAEDIGKFPDPNLAESLLRIPDVAATREQGEGREITVSGLGPQFTRVRINGMETLTTPGAMRVGTSADGFDATCNPDASRRYNLTSHFRVSLGGVNLTHQFENEFNDFSRNLVTYYPNTGRQILAGVRYQY